jgi:hypothetical protein
MPAQHGNRSRYNAGCRCDPCKGANRDYQKMRGQSIRNAKHAPATVTALPRTPATVQAANPDVGRVEAGVLAEIDGLSTAASRQGLVEIAIALARVLDSPLAIAQHASAGHRLSETLDKIRKGSDSKKSKLAAVRSMTRPTEVAG